jgi:hypothetical protein
MRTGFERIVTYIYLIAAVALALMALVLMGWAVVEVWHEVVAKSVVEDKFISTMLRSVGAIIIAVAIIDVAKYMIEEEVLEHRQKRSQKEVRETLTKILIIVTIAVGIEGLIYIFKAGAKDIKLLVYPAMLIITAVIMIVGLGIYQKLSVEVENMERDEKDGDEAETHSAHSSS